MKDSLIYNTHATLRTLPLKINISGQFFPRLFAAIVIKILLPDDAAAAAVIPFIPDCYFMSIKTFCESSFFLLPGTLKLFSDFLFFLILTKIDQPKAQAELQKKKPSHTRLTAPFNNAIKDRDCLLISNNIDYIHPLFIWSKCRELTLTTVTKELKELP